MVFLITGGIVFYLLHLVMKGKVERDMRTQLQADFTRVGQRYCEENNIPKKDRRKMIKDVSDVYLRKGHQ